MIIASYFFIVNVVLPQMGAYAQVLIRPIMLILITLAGIVMMFGAVGMRISNNLGSTVVNGIFRAIGYIGTTIIRGIVWIVRSITRAIARVFNGSRRTFVQCGLNQVLSNFLAMLVTLVIVAIII